MSEDEGEGEKEYRKARDRDARFKEKLAKRTREIVCQRAKAKAPRSVTLVCLLFREGLQIMRVYAVYICSFVPSQT